MARKPKPAAPAATTTPIIRAVAAGRVSTDRPDSPFGWSLKAILPPPNAMGDWRSLDLDSRTLDRISPLKLAELLIDVSPDVSRALFDWLREVNAGWELTATTPGTDEPFPQAQISLDAMVGTLTDLYGTADVPINRLFMSAWMRGAILAELVLDASGRGFADLATPDPTIARFRPTTDPIRGTVYELGQMQGGQWVSFASPTISYIPVDPLPGSPYGRPLVAPALFVTLFLIGLLHDLRRVIAQQGYPRLDISVNLERLAAEMQAQDIPAGLRQSFVDQIVNQVAAAYAELEPESAFVHTDLVVVNRPVGTVDTQSLGGVAPILDMLERSASRALKTLPFMQGLSETNSEAMSNRQYEAHMTAIRSMQHLVETQLGSLFGLALQAQGIVADVMLRFTENRASEEERDERTAALRIANARARYDHGWIDQNTAAFDGAGVDLADQSEPREAAAAPADVGPAPVIEPGGNRAVPTNGHRSVDDLLATIS